MNPTIRRHDTTVILAPRCYRSTGPVRVQMTLLDRFRASGQRLRVDETACAVTFGLNARYAEKGGAR